MCNKFLEVSMNEKNPSWEKCIKRQNPIYLRHNDIRTEFARDYTRILHCLAYRRLKHKTQVFFNTQNDHICTRMEHVAHVESISYTIGKALGLNTELTRAIATGHDLGHAPFGHTGEEIINKIFNEKCGYEEVLNVNGKIVNQEKLYFWHERNGLRFIDKIELLLNAEMEFCNLNLTYAVRDGIISHCGEVDQNGIFPRKEYIDLKDFTAPGQYNPYTWEGCVVKLSDKIAYLGRDIEDAIDLHIISDENLNELNSIIKPCGVSNINTSKVIHEFITDLVKNSSIKNGIVFSDNMVKMMKEIKEFNYEVIYNNEKMQYFHKYSKLIIESLFDALYYDYDERGVDKIISKLREERKYTELKIGFADWLEKYCKLDVHDNVKKYELYKNIKIYGDLTAIDDYVQAIADYISGMTDSYAIKCFEELVSF